MPKPRHSSTRSANLFTRPQHLRKSNTRRTPTAIALVLAMAAVALIAPMSASAAPSTTVTPPAVTPPTQARTWGPAGPESTLVVYDTTGTYGFLGQEDAIEVGNLVTHFGQVTAEPVIDYKAGQVADFNATVYIGSTYNEPIPAAFLSDVHNTNRPVIWMGDNVWQLSGASASQADASFVAKYGWDPATSYFDTTDGITEVNYKGQHFTRFPDPAGVLAPHITNPSAVTTLASAVCSAPGQTAAPTFSDTNSAATSTSATINFAPATNCATIAQTTGSSFPWALSSANLTYIGEIPLSYMTETDRYLIFSDLLYTPLDASAPVTHTAMVRLEDVAADDDAASIQTSMAWMEQQHVPFSVNVIPQFLDPSGYYNNGVPESLTIGSNTALVSDLKTAIASGYGSLNQEGYTHQYSNPTTGKAVDNPYTGVSGDDFEFYSSYCSKTQTNPTPDPAGCPSTDWVIYKGPVANDSAAWATSRIKAGQALFTAAGLPVPKNLVVPHYGASAADYQAFAPMFSDRYDRGLYFYGQLSSTTPDYTKLIGQFFPYPVKDVDGSVVIPEDLGDYEPTAMNNHPPRSTADIAIEAAQNSVLHDGFASFFYDAQDEGLAPLQQVVQAITALGYKWASPTTVDTTYTSATSTKATTAYNPVAVTGVAPSAGPATGGNAVTIEGAGFTGTTSVLWGTKSVPFTVKSASEISVVAPAGTTSVDVRVINGKSESDQTSADLYSYVGVPTVTNVSPASVPSSTPTSVTITGTNFTGVTQVNFCGDPEPFTVSSSTSITSTSPQTTYVGGCWLTVTTQGGTSAQAPFNFTG